MTKHVINKQKMMQFPNHLNGENAIKFSNFNKILSLFFVFIIYSIFFIYNQFSFNIDIRELQNSTYIEHFNNTQSDIVFRNFSAEFEYDFNYDWTYFERTNTLYTSTTVWFCKLYNKNIHVIENSDFILEEIFNNLSHVDDACLQYGNLTLYFYQPYGETI